MEDDLGGNATSLAFRVNRGEIVLNDANSGTVWDVQQDKPIRIDNWEAFTSKKKNKDDDEENENQTDADRRPPRAKPDSYGVRAGRTTVLHPLDNDSAPDGRLLSIVDVDQPSGGARVEISPDGQTLVLEMPEDGRPARFDYFIDDGRNGLSANAAVDVTVRGSEQNEPPALREGWKKPTYKVPHGGELAVPVLGDWRDDSDGDTLLLESAKAVGGEESGAAARTTADGRIRFTAPTGPADGSQLVRVEFAVTDGRSAPVTKSMSFQVQAPKDQKSYAPQAEPDVVRGEVGKPIKIRPLLNDLPGSDPNATDAELSLGGKVPQQPNAKVVTDLDAGQLTFTGERAGTYFLSYDAAFGNAPLDQGTIRVDVKASPKRAADPIAMPDTLTVYGQAPGIVDVLANDLDPAGGLLVVQRAVGRPRRPARRGDRRRALAAHLRDPPRPRSRHADRLLHDQQRHQLRRPRGGGGHPASGAGGQHPDHGLRQGRGAGRRLRRGARARQRRVPGGRPPDPAQRPVEHRHPGPARGGRPHRRHRRRRQGLRVRPRGALRRAREGRGARHLHRHATSRRTSRASAPTAPSR